MAPLIVNELPKFARVPKLTLSFSELVCHGTRKNFAVWRLFRK
jgi:hypothetical protein